MTPSLSITNILQALYEESPTIKMYVDCIASGQPAPFTLITKSTEHEKNEQIVQRVREELERILREDDWDGECRECGYGKDTILEILDEAMILEDEIYEIAMFKDGVEVQNTRQVVKSDKVQGLKDYAKFKDYTISVKLVKQ